MATTFVAIRIPDELLNIIDEVAVKEMRTRSNTINYLLEKALHDTRIQQTDSKGKD